MQTFDDFEIIFVDNNSSDGSAEFVESLTMKQKTKVIRSGRNLGFAGGNNMGYQHSSGEYIVLLNNDTVTDRDWLGKLIECIESGEDTGIAQSLVLTEGIPLKYYRKNGTVNLLGHNIMETFEIGDNGTGEIFIANGCSLIIRKSLVETLGGLFPGYYFAYSEDTYLCMKVKFRGLRIMHTSGSVVHHKGGGTSEKIASPLYFYQERNRLLNFFLFFSGSFLLRQIPYFIFNFSMKSAASVISRKYSFSGLVKAHWWILINAKQILFERKILNSAKLRDELYVLGYLTSRLFNGDNILQRMINFISLIYCKLVFIRVLENRKHR